MKPRKCYELKVGGVLAARGKIDMIADLLGVSIDTARRYPYKGHSPRGIELRALPNLYRYRGRLYMMDELSEQVGMTNRTILSVISKGSGLRGYKVSKHQYDEFSVSREELELLREKIDVG